MPFAWQWKGYDKLRKGYRAEIKGYWCHPLWGIWNGYLSMMRKVNAITSPPLREPWPENVKISRIDLCVDVVGEMPEQPPRDTWRIILSRTGRTFYYSGTEFIWRIYCLEDDAAPEHRPAQYLLDLKRRGLKPSQVVRYECETHGSVARELATELTETDAWRRLPRPPVILIPDLDGETVRATRRPTVPPETLREFELRLQSYVNDCARRYAKRCGVSRLDFQAAAQEMLGRMAHQWPTPEEEVEAYAAAHRADQAAKVIERAAMSAQNAAQRHGDDDQVGARSDAPCSSSLEPSKSSSGVIRRRPPPSPRT